MATRHIMLFDQLIRPIQLALVVKCIYYEISILFNRVEEN
jgi:hypothetical protein